MLSNSADRIIVETAIKFLDQMPDAPSTGLLDSLDRIMIDVQTLECLETQEVCGRCPIAQTRNAAGSVTKKERRRGRQD